MPGEDEDRDGRAGREVNAGGTTARTTAAYRHAAGRQRRLLDGGPNDYQAEACYGATLGYEDLATPRLLIMHLIGAVLCSVILLQHDMRIFEVFLWGTPTIGTRHRAAFVGLVETRMTTLGYSRCPCGAHPRSAHATARPLAATYVGTTTIIELVPHTLARLP